MVAGAVTLAFVRPPLGVGVEEAGTGQYSSSTWPPFMVQVSQFFGGMQFVKEQVGDGDAKPANSEIVMRTEVDVEGGKTQRTPLLST
jgi:hypothetical protein